MTGQSVAADFLSATYQALGLDSGQLLTPSSRPSGQNDQDWERVGDWLTTAERMGADRVFFVGDDPVLVFAAMPTGSTELDILRMYRRAWSLSRPQCLFVASLGEMRVYDLMEPPPANRTEWEQLRPLEVIRETAQVAERLSDFDIDRLEAGTSFGRSVELADKQLTGRRKADDQLLSDVRAAVQDLAAAGLDFSLAHLLVQRVILVRYLEDRGVITDDYIVDLLGQSLNVNNIESADNIVERPSAFTAALSSPTSTYTIFDALSQEFNGDLFGVSRAEVDVVTEEHLQLLQRMLLGDVENQRPLFLWAYDFSVVPTNLISSMYEQFYQASISGSDDRSGGTHYTPVELAEFVLSRILTDDRLREEPNVCDPACGSGVFLVEAYKRMVRHHASRLGRPLKGQELRQILLHRLAGIDFNPEAIRLAAFGLYLAYLNYQSPQDIRAAGPLPALIVKSESSEGVLCVNDAFAPLKGDTQQGLPLHTSSLPWASGHFDILIGNPPWDKPRVAERSLAERWAQREQLPVGERSPSQLFLWRSLYLLRRGGLSGMLVHQSTVLGDRKRTVEFRRSWLQSVRLREVVNFSQARRIFFSTGVAPFVMLTYENDSMRLGDDQVNYLMVRPTAALKTTRLISYGRLDRRQLSQDSLIRRDYLWKVYAWGNRHDDALMSRLDLEKTLGAYIDPGNPPGYGYQRGDARQSFEPSEALRTLPCLYEFRPWGPIRDEDYEDRPTTVKRDPSRRLYDGQRLIVRRGVTAGWGPYTRLLQDSMAFRHTIYSIPLGHLANFEALTLAGIALSSLGRYRVFMLSSSWGSWFDQTVSGDVLKIPVRIPTANHAGPIAELVRQIQSWSPNSPEAAVAGPQHLLRLLNDEVYKLFELSSTEVDLVEDWVANRLPLTRGISKTVEIDTVHGRAAGGVDDTDEAGQIGGYLRLLVSNWNRNLTPDGEMTWEVLSDTSRSYIAVLLQTRVRGLKDDPADLEASTAWRQALTLADRSSDRIRGPRGVLERGVVRVVGDTYVMVMKPADARLWSRAAASEDYEATLLQAMNLAAQ